MDMLNILIWSSRNINMYQNITSYLIPLYNYYMSIYEIIFQNKLKRGFVRGRIICLRTVQHGLQDILGEEGSQSYGLSYFRYRIVIVCDVLRYAVASSLMG
jgi:hypothetical protein